MLSIPIRSGACSLLLLLAACGGGGADDSSHTVSITVTGLRLSYDGATLRNNGGDDLKVYGDGTFAFKTALATGSAYAVTVAAQPSGPDQACTVTNGSGTIAGSDVTNVAIDCPYATAYAVGGTVSGLTGTGLTLQYNADNISLPSIDQVNANGAFLFDANRTSAVNGTVYGISIANQPTNPAQTCVVVNGSGTVAGADVNGVDVMCGTHTVSLTITGLRQHSAHGIKLQNNGGDDLVRFVDGSYAFATPLPAGSAYSVTIAAEPQTPDQTCTVSNGSGTMGSSDITNVVVDCPYPPARSVGGTITGMTGTGLDLTYFAPNLGVQLGTAAITGTGFVFGESDTSAISGTSYSISVRVQPTNQTCYFTGPGAIAGTSLRQRHGRRHRRDRPQPDLRRRRRGPALYGAHRRRHDARQHQCRRDLDRSRQPAHRALRHQRRSRGDDPGVRGGAHRQGRHGHGHAERQPRRQRQPGPARHLRGQGRRAGLGVDPQPRRHAVAEPRGPDRRRRLRSTPTPRTPARCTCKARALIGTFHVDDVEIADSRARASTSTARSASTPPRRTCASMARQATRCTSMRASSARSRAATTPATVDDEIAIAGSGGPVLDDQTLHDRGVPYHVGSGADGGRMDVNSQIAGQVAVLSIEPGVIVRFPPGGTLNVDPASGNTPAQGALIAIGSAQATDRLHVGPGGQRRPATGSASASAAASIRAATMQNARVAFAGGTSVSGSNSCPYPGVAVNEAAIRIFGPPLSQFITNTEIVSSARFGIDRGWRADLQPDFLASNTFSAVASCRETTPRTATGVCPATVPCP